MRKLSDKISLIDAPSKTTQPRVLTEPSSATKSPSAFFVTVCLSTQNLKIHCTQPASAETLEERLMLLVSMEHASGSAA